MGKLKEVLSDLAKDYKEAIQRLIIQEELVDKGDLKNSIKFEVTDNGFSITSDEKYAYILGSNGYLKRWRRPSIPKLAEWVKRKGIRPRGKNGRFKKITDKTYLSTAFAIARSMNGEGNKNVGKNGSIKRFGYRGSRIIQRVNQQMEGKLAVEITEAYRLELIEGMKQTFEFDNIKIQ